MSIASCWRRRLTLSLINRKHYLSIWRLYLIFIPKRKDGREFEIKPATKSDSPLSVEGVDPGVSTSEIVDVAREIRE
jgi:hypothetical protein